MTEKKDWRLGVEAAVLAAEFPERPQEIDFPLNEWRPDDEPLKSVLRRDKPVETGPDRKSVQ